eukprot:1956033-Amphidinium_carterae.1
MHAIAHIPQSLDAKRCMRHQRAHKLHNASNQFFACEAEGRAFLANNLDVPAMCAYVEQDDALFALSTIEESH